MPLSRRSLPQLACLCLLSIALPAGCSLFGFDDDEDRYDPFAPQITQVGGIGNSISVLRGGRDPNVRYIADQPDGSSTHVVCTPDGRFVSTVSLTGAPAPMSAIGRQLDDAIDADRRAINDIDNRARQCRGRSKGLTDYDAERGCDRPQYRRIKETLNEVKWQRSHPGISDARDRELLRQQNQIGAQLAPFAGPCEYAEELYRKDPCSVTQLSEDAWDRPRRQQSLAEAQRQRELFKRCEDDLQQRQAQSVTGIRTPTTEDALIHVLPGIIGTIGPRPHGDRRDRDPHRGSSVPHGHSDPHGDHH
ncbi:MAG: hypothetical protein IT563_20765 [Alphaproteobacteria bacterium]|nr:hypothetical protein [Alphaproteobacteria bacterium]